MLCQLLISFSYKKYIQRFFCSFTLFFFHIQFRSNLILLTHIYFQVFFQCFCIILFFSVTFSYYCSLLLLALGFSLFFQFLFLLLETYVWMYACEWSTKWKRGKCVKIDPWMRPNIQCSRRARQKYTFLVALVAKGEWFCDWKSSWLILKLTKNFANILFKLEI